MYRFGMYLKLSYIIAIYRKALYIKNSKAHLLYVGI